jgi:ubiquinone/menaquinone biosynthesis C-methylase UbiE
MEDAMTEHDERPREREPHVSNDEHAGVPNHHAHLEGFHGWRGTMMAFLFLFRRSEDSQVACDVAAVSRGDHIVDIGCGSGVTVRSALKRGATVTGVDPAPVMLRVARLTTWRPSWRHHATWKQGTAESLPVADACADAAWSLATVHHWDDVDAGLAEVERVLKPGGTFVAMEGVRVVGATDHRSHGWTRSQADVFAEAMRSHGFTDVEIDTGHVERGDIIWVTGVKR